MSRKVVITGASRGIGAELARQYAERGWEVFATCRNPDGAELLKGLQAERGDAFRVVPMDVTDPASVAAAAEAIAERTDGIEVLINNAGRGADHEDGLFCVEEEQMIEVFKTNAVGPVTVTKALYPLLKNGENPRVVSIISGVASLRRGDFHPGRQLSYAGSKGALNFFICQMAADLKGDGIASIGLGPGFVLTDMTREAEITPPLRPPESASSMIRLIDHFTLEHSGRFFEWDGMEYSWVEEKG